MALQRGQVWCEEPCFLAVGVHPAWWSHLQIDRADAETGAVTAGLLGATPRPPVCGVYQGGLSPPLRGMSQGHEKERLQFWSRKGRGQKGIAKSRLLLSLS